MYEETKVSSSQVNCSVLGRGAEFMLLPTEEVAEADATMAQIRNFSYCGLLAIEDGIPAVFCESTPGSAVTMAHAALEFCRRYADRIAPIAAPVPKQSDSLVWLESLHSICDPR